MDSIEIKTKTKMRMTMTMTMTMMTRNDAFAQRLPGTFLEAKS